MTRNRNLSDLPLRLGVAVAQADGRVAPEELAQIREHARRRIRELGSDDRERLDVALRALEADPQDPDALASRLSRLTSRERCDLLAQLFDVALADGAFVAEEHALLERVHAMLGTDAAHFDALLKTALLSAPMRGTSAGEATLNELLRRLRQRRLREKLDQVLASPKDPT